MSGSKKIYIISDLHLGIDADLSSRDRELKLLRWFDMVMPTAKEVILLGDSFDYWFEYRKTIPRGFNRFIGKLAECADHGIEISMFTGNHDVWMFDYFQNEIGAKIYTSAIHRKLGNQKVLMGHGDGLGPGDRVYKTVKLIFNNKICQWLFARIHPNLGLGIMRFCSKDSRKLESSFDAKTERLIHYCEDSLDQNKIDAFIFGHRHLPIVYTLSDGSSRYINTGDWLHHYSYLEIDENEIKMKFFENENAKVYGN